MCGEHLVVRKARFIYDPNVSMPMFCLAFAVQSHLAHGRRLDILKVLEAEAVERISDEHMQPAGLKQRQQRIQSRIS